MDTDYFDNGLRHGYSPTDSTDIHRFFLNTNNSNDTNNFPQITQIYTDFLEQRIKTDDTDFTNY